MKITKELIGKHFIFQNALDIYKYIGTIKEIEIEASGIYAIIGTLGRCITLEDSETAVIFDNEDDARLFIELKNM